jgi:transposase-like protein
MLGGIYMTISDILTLILTLPQNEQETLKTLFLNNTSKVLKIEQLVSEQRFTHGVVCPICGSVGHASRNGHRKDGKQRYICKDCDKSFVSNTNSITSGTRKDYSVWKAYIQCMVNGLSVRKTAELCDIHRNTAFIWRHKILDALNKVYESTKLEGIVEADETFFSVSFKGNHKKSMFVMPRKSRKRGKSVHVRGLSYEKVCVPCAIDRTGNAFSKIATLGRVKTKDLHSVYDGKLQPDTTLCTDKMNAYVRFANSSNLELVQLKSGKEKKGIFNIQHINAYHSKLKGFLRPFNGVSTKYLNNYLIWQNWINQKPGSNNDKVDTLLKTACSTIANIKCNSLSNRPVIPIAS